MMIKGGNKHTCPGGGVSGEGFILTQGGGDGCSNTYEENRTLGVNWVLEKLQLLSKVFMQKS